MIEKEFFNCNDHKSLLNSILNTIYISNSEKDRRIDMRRKLASNSFCKDPTIYGIKQFERTSDKTITEMLKDIKAHFKLC